MKNNSSLSLDMFDYDLPADLIAQRPADPRTASRLLHLNRGEGTCDHLAFTVLPRLLREGDLLVLNDTKVFPARLMTRRDSGGLVEVFLLEFPADREEVPCLVRPGRRLGDRERLFLEDGSALLVRRGGTGFTVSGMDIRLEEAVREFGQVPLPPYIRREGDGPDEADRIRYQTVYASSTGAVAAPTAGLHFDERLLERIRQKGVLIGTVTLHVGVGTFKPVRSRDITTHRMEEEFYTVPADAADLIENTRQRGGRVVAVGTTVVRTLEAAFDGRSVKAGPGRTALFIYPGHRFEVVDALVTNFHLPRSTLLMLVCAFAGSDLVMEAYREAVRRQYRFYSYGDAIIIE